MESLLSKYHLSGHLSYPDKKAWKYVIKIMASLEASVEGKWKRGVIILEIKLKIIAELENDRSQRLVSKLWNQW